METLAKRELDICAFTDVDVLILFVITLQIIFLLFHLRALKIKEIDLQIGVGILPILLWGLTFLSPFPEFLDKSFYSVIINFCFGCSIILFCCTAISYFNSKFKR